MRDIDSFLEKQGISHSLLEAVKKAASSTEQLDEAFHLDKVNPVTHEDNESARSFAKDYTKAHKGDFSVGGPTEKHTKDSEYFWNKYDSKSIRGGFAGSGTTEYTHKETGKKFLVDRQANGKTFYGTNHHITVSKSIKEEVEQLDEISDKLKQEYLNRSDIDFDKKMKVVTKLYDKHRKSPDPEAIEKANKILNKVDKRTEYARKLKKQGLYAESTILDEAKNYLKTKNAEIHKNVIPAFFPKHAEQVLAMKDGQKKTITVGGDKHTFIRKGDMFHATAQFHESVEELDELSKEKLGQYIVAATIDKEKNRQKYNDASKKKFNTLEPHKAVKDSYETEDMFNMRKNTLQRRKNKFSNIMKASTKNIEKRNAGTSLAARKLSGSAKVVGESEQLDESLISSHKTLKISDRIKEIIPKELGSEINRAKFEIHKRDLKNTSDSSDKIMMKLDIDNTKYDIGSHVSVDAAKQFGKTHFGIKD